VTAEHRARGRADDDLVRLRQCLQTRRQVRRLADDRGLRCRSFADLVADDHRSRGDADPHRELDPGRPRDRGIQLRHRIDDIETHPHRTLGLVLMGPRVAEIDEDAVAHVLRDKAVVAPDRRAAAVLIRRDDVAQIFGSIPVESAVDPTRSQNITVSWRRSAWVGAGAGGGTDKGVAVRAGAGAAAPSAAMAERSLRRWPTEVTPMLIRSSAVSSGRTSPSTSLSWNPGTYCSSPSPRSHAAMSMR
jgi:hypothetical protein